MKRKTGMTQSLLRGGLVLALGLTLAACTGGLSPLNGPQHGLSVREKHPIVVSPDEQTLLVTVTRETTALRREEKARIHAFAKAYLARGHGPLVIAAPAGAPNAQAAVLALAEVNEVLVEAGLAPHGYQARAYAADPQDGAAPIVMTFTAFIAEGPRCGDFDRNLAWSPRNRTTPNFGCATQANLAAMISDPRDLTVPRTMTPADPERRGAVLDAYRKGETTVSDKAEEENAAVSKVDD